MTPGIRTGVSTPTFLHLYIPLSFLRTPVIRRVVSLKNLDLPWYWFPGLHVYCGRKAVQIETARYHLPSSESSQITA